MGDGQCISGWALTAPLVDLRKISRRVRHSTKREEARDTPESVWRVRLLPLYVLHVDPVHVDFVCGYSNALPHLHAKRDGAYDCHSSGAGLRSRVAGGTRGSPRPGAGGAEDLAGGGWSSSTTCASGYGSTQVMASTALTLVLLQLWSFSCSLVVSKHP